MTVRPPRSHSGRLRECALAYEIAQEQAAALGRLGRALEAALAALSACDRALPARDEGPAAASAQAKREQLVQDASYALWCFIIQREACGLRDLRLIVRQYGIPAEVQNRMGACGGNSRTPSA